MTRTTMLATVALWLASMPLAAQPPPAVPQPPCTPGENVVCGQQGPEDFRLLTGQLPVSLVSRP